MLKLYNHYNICLHNIIVYVNKTLLLIKNFIHMEFKIISRKIPGKPTEPEKFYATIVRPNNVKLETLAKRISEISPVNELDTKLALQALIFVLPEYLSEGATAELGDFGRLMVTINSKGSDTEEDFSKELIKGITITYYPSTKVKKILKGVDFKKVG